MSDRDALFNSTTQSDLEDVVRAYIEGGLDFTALMGDAQTLWAAELRERARDVEDWKVVRR